MRIDRKLAQQKAAKTAKWATIVVKVRIRKIKSRTKWELVSFCGPCGCESVGVVDIMAVRKDHRRWPAGAKRGDALQIVLIQVKGGSSAMPTPEDARRLRAVSRQHNVHSVLLATWRKGSSVRFFMLREKNTMFLGDWKELIDPKEVFH